MQHYKQGYTAYTQRAKSSLHTILPRSDKRFWMKKDTEPIRVIILLPHLDQLTWRYEHYIWSAKNRNITSKIRDLRVSCCSVDVQEDQASRCPACNEMLFQDGVLRSFVWDMPIIDLSIVEMQGQKWSHTVKNWALKEVQGNTLCQIILRESSSGKCGGMEFEVYRSGHNAPACGSQFQFKGWHNLQNFKLRSARTDWYLKKCRDEGRSISREQAAEEYFAVPNFADMLFPTPSRLNYFLLAVKRVFGQTSEGAQEEVFSSESGWDTPQPSVPQQGGPQQYGGYPPPQPQPQSKYGTTPPQHRPSAYLEEGNDFPAIDPPVYRDPTPPPVAAAPPTDVEELNPPGQGGMETPFEEEPGLQGEYTPPPQSSKAIKGENFDEKLKG